MGPHHQKSKKENMAPDYLLSNEENQEDSSWEWNGPVLAMYLNSDKFESMFMMNLKIFLFMFHIFAP